MPDRFLLDTSALLTFLQAEPGAQRVLRVLEDATRGEVEAAASFVSLTEVQYITSYDFGDDAARDAIAVLKRLSIAWQHSDDELCARAADVKARHSVSFADSYVVATALRLDAVLLHKDQELAAIPAPLKQEMLPPKQRNALAGGRSEAS
jgi:ribonuclease VapC